MSAIFSSKHSREKRQKLCNIHEKSEIFHMGINSTLIKNAPLHMAIGTFYSYFKAPKKMMGTHLSMG